MTDASALRLGLDLASQLGYDVSTLDIDALTRFGRASNQAFNAWGGRTTLPVELLSLPSAPILQHAGSLGGAAVAPPVPALERIRVMHRPSRLGRLLGSPVARAAILAGLGLLGVDTLGWLPTVAVIGMGTTSAAAVWVSQQ